jgi:uncharacterized Zn finger protein
LQASDIEHIPRDLLLNFESVQEFVGGANAAKHGRNLVRCGDVYLVKRLPRLDAYSFSGVVHAEVKKNVAYEVKVAFGADGKLTGTRCVCTSANLAHTKCKHVAALLYALIVLRRPDTEAA